MTANTQKHTDASLPFLERALKQSLHSPTFLDVKFFAFSRRIYLGDGSIRVDKPQHVLAISSVMKKTDYFEKLLSGGFAESNAIRVPIDANFPADKAPFSDEYDYDSDSDLDDEEVSDNDMDVIRIHSRESEQSGAGPSGSGGDHLSFGGVQCQQIIITDVAYLTWRAFVFYLYFGKVNFLPLKSTEDQDRAAELERALNDENAVPPCSPKSMYRLAEKYGITDLQTLAFEAIRSRLSAKNIVQEVFSRFTSRYERVRELEIAFMRSHYSELGGALSSITDRLVQGEFPYAAEVLKTLLDIKNESNNSKGSSNTATSLASTIRTTRSPAFLLPGGRRSHSRGNVAPPPFRTSYHALFSPPQPTTTATTAPVMMTSTSGGTSSTSSNNASGTPMWSTYSFAVDDDDM
ncbi:hypothetical protein DAEQUDRAFT_730896 [Daedalea quercina L-15889]|uniref:BTB domain-containing protein n=1 Tax=Daedalea quercina L-15889 TaxID=1314783 RepID=A0A165MPZ3_9APHY|nr:hypothetical protein DAEQUDRAFT_730896 [Daedalea quercina L-15889]